MKKKSIFRVSGILILVFAMVFVMASCGEKGPAAYVDKEIGNIISSKNCEKEVQDVLEDVLEEEMNISDDNEKDFKKYYDNNIKKSGIQKSLVDILTSAKYEVSDEKVSGDKATVKVTVKTKNYGDAFTKAGLKGLDKLVAELAEKNLSEEAIEDDDFYSMVFKFYGNALKKSVRNAEDGYESSVTLHLKKDDGEWELENEDKGQEALDLFNVLTGGMVDGIQNMEDAINRM